MSNPSALETIEANVVAKLATLVGFAQAVLPSEVFKVKLHPVTGDAIGIDPVSLPGNYPGGSYPGCIVSLNEDEVKPSGDPGDCGQVGSYSIVTYEVPIYVALYMTSDGTDDEEVRRNARRMTEDLQRALMVFPPVTVPTNGMVAPWVLRAAEFAPIPADANTFGMLMKFWAKYQLQAKLM